MSASHPSMQLLADAQDRSDRRGYWQGPVEAAVVHIFGVSADLIRFKTAVKIECTSCGNSRTVSGFEVVQICGTQDLRRLHVEQGKQDWLCSHQRQPGTSLKVRLGWKADISCGSMYFSAREQARRLGSVVRDSRSFGSKGDIAGDVVARLSSSHKLADRHSQVARRWRIVIGKNDDAPAAVERPVGER